MLFLALLFSTCALASETGPSPESLAETANTYMRVALREMGVSEDGAAGSRFMELKDIRCVPRMGRKVRCTAMAEREGQPARKIVIPDTRNFLMNLRRLVKAQHLRPSREDGGLHLASMTCRSETSEEGGETTACTLREKDGEKAKAKTKAPRKAHVEDAGAAEPAQGPAQ